MFRGNVAGDLEIILEVNSLFRALKHCPVYKNADKKKMVKFTITSSAADDHSFSGVVFPCENQARIAALIVQSSSRVANTSQCTLNL